MKSSIQSEPKKNAAKRIQCALVGTGLVLAFACNLAAAPTYLALRLGNQGTCSLNAATKQIVASTLGTNLCSLPFAGSTTYDFYSPPLAAAASLTTNDTCGGTIVMSNSAPTSANDFVVTGLMQFYDYDPAAGVNTLIANSGVDSSSLHSVNHDEMKEWTLIQNPLPASYTLPAGHLLHIAVVVALESGNPGPYGQLVFNGPAADSSTTAQFPQNNVFSWNYSPTLSLVALPDHTISLTCLGAGGTNYVVEATTNLALSAWVTICTNTAGSDGIMTFVDQDTTKYPCRFYRIEPAN